jgi:hypothetical protein
MGPSATSTAKKVSPRAAGCVAAALLCSVCASACANIWGFGDLNDSGDVGSADAHANASGGAADSARVDPATRDASFDAPEVSAIDLSPKDGSDAPTTGGESAGGGESAEDGSTSGDVMGSDVTGGGDDVSLLDDADGELDSSVARTADAGEELDAGSARDAAISDGGAERSPPPTFCAQASEVIELDGPSGNTGRFATLGLVCVVHRGSIAGWGVTSGQGRLVTAYGATTVGPLDPTKVSTLPALGAGPDGFIYWILTAGTSAFTSLFFF